MAKVAVADLVLTPEQVVVTVQQMQEIEAAMFADGMPVAALMEKVAGRVVQWLTQHYPRDRTPTVGFIIGPGHNGGDALVVARELYHQGYQVLLWCPFSRIKELTAQHKSYVEQLGVRLTTHVNDLSFCDLIVDGGFGLGLTRSLTGDFAAGVEAINRWQIPVVSLDLPSGLESDTGQVLGTAIRADHTLCLGLWKLGLLQDQALPWMGQTHLIPFDVPPKLLPSLMAGKPTCRRITPAEALAHLPLQRPENTHKYQVGHGLLIAGSQQYIGAAILAGKGAIASGVGMLTVVVPESIKPIVINQFPEALVIAAPETPAGAIASLPPTLTWDKYDVVACGPGLTAAAAAILPAILACDRPLLLDADGLNWLAQNQPLQQLRQRSAPTLLTPHLGEFRRLFPACLEEASTPSAAAQLAAKQGQCTVALKGALSAIAHPDQSLWFNPDSTPALARGGSGDVLTGLVLGVAAQQCQRLPPEDLWPGAAIGAIWWHAQTGRSLAATRTLLGCSPTLLADHLPVVLGQILATLPPAITGA